MPVKLETQPAVATEDVDRLRAAVMRLSRELRRNIADEGLTPTESTVLGAIVRAEEMPLSELSAHEGLNPTMVSRVVGTLESRELVIRVKDATDRRAGRVRATAGGKRLVQRLRTRRSNELTKRIEELDNEGLTTLMAALPALEQLAGIKRGGA